MAKTNPPKKGYRQTDEGRLQIGAFMVERGRPVENATVQIKEKGQEQTIEEVITDLSGQSPVVYLPAPPVEYSLEPDQPKPYSEYDLRINAPGFDPILIQGVQVLPDSTANQDVFMQPAVQLSRQEEVIVIPEHVLYGTYPPKIHEEEVKELPPESGFVVLDQPVVPEYIIVHDGLPTNTGAQNYWVPFKDYIKNVACSEIYSTWPEASIRANILAIISFTLNRVYTEWYRSQGYNFTITSSTAYVITW